MNLMTAILRHNGQFVWPCRFTSIESKRFSGVGYDAGSQGGPEGGMKK